MNNSFPDFLLNESDEFDNTENNMPFNYHNLSNINIITIPDNSSQSEDNESVSESSVSDEYNNESDYSQDYEDEIINIRRCNNYEICKQLKGSSLNYCDDCFLYFYRNLIKYKNTNNTCPLCLNSDKNIEFINIYTCEHGICYNCLFSIYWDKSYLNKQPKFPIVNLFKSWNKFLTTKKGLQIRARVINSIIYNNYLRTNRFDIGYSLFLRKISLCNIPKKILIHLKDLIFHQCKLLEFNNNHSKNQYIKQKSIEVCPYCKASQLISC